MALEPKPEPCAWCHWPVRLVPPPRDPDVPAADADAEAARVRQCTNPWCPTRRPGFGVAP